MTTDSDFALETVPPDFNPEAVEGSKVPASDLLFVGPDGATLGYPARLRVLDRLRKEVEAADEALSVAESRLERACMRHARLAVRDGRPAVPAEEPLSHNPAKPDLLARADGGTPIGGGDS